MMRHELALSLGGEHLVLEVFEVRGNDWLSQLLGRPAASESLARVELAGTAGDSIRSRLDQAIEGLPTIYKQSLSGLNLSVQLGLTYSHIGVLRVEESVRAFSPDVCDAYSQAWIREMLHLDPATQIIRSQALANDHGLLISSIDRAAYESLVEISSQRGLRFVGCRAAVLDALDKRVRGDEGLADSADQVIVWTEVGADSLRSARVQILRLKGGSLAGCWRGWVEVPAGSASDDKTLEGALHRFQMSGSLSSTALTTHLHWPFRAEAVAA